MNRETPWHAIQVDEVFKALRTTPQGLDEEEAERRLRTYGPNRIEEEKKTSPLKLFLGQFLNPLTGLLLFATFLSLAIGEALDAIVIIILVLAGAVIGFYQEYRAERALEALKKMTSPQATVIRSGKVKTIRSEEVVPGDVLVLNAGDRVAADARIFEAVNLKVDESMLTGESVPVEKTVGALSEDTPLVDRTNMVFSGTVVVYGKGKAIVVATGRNTELGRIAESIQEVKAEKTPLERQLSALGRMLLILMVVIASIVSVVGMSVWGYKPLQILLWALSLAVAAVPEALPVVVTSSLAIGVYRMAKRNAIVKRLPAVETLGSTTYICSDKTGTMTKGEMTAVKVWVYDVTFEVTGAGYEPTGEITLGGRPVNVAQVKPLELLLLNAYNNNDSEVINEGGRWIIKGDTTEGALKVLALKAGVSSSLGRLGEIPFSSERKRMSTLHLLGGRAVMFVKGAPEVLVPLSSRILTLDGETREITEEVRRRILEVNDALAREGLRNIAFAARFFDDGKKDISEEDEKDLVFLGIVALIDPPRPEVKNALEVCKRAGIKVSMITGDHKLTAVSIARQLGMLGEGDLVVTGSELEKMSEKELEDSVERIRVYARVSPEHKLRIVQALKKRGHVVAMTGDGVNDAPALKAADVGVAMGITGTEVAKEASSMVLADDNFATIVEAIKLGREIFENIRKYLAYLLSANIVELVTPLFSTLLGLPIPFTATQILWVNLVTDGAPAIALSLEPGEPDLLERKPRKPNSPLFSKAEVVAFFVVFPLLFALSLVLLFKSLLKSGLPVIEARTTLFTAMILGELVLAYLFRSLRSPAYKLPPLRNKALLLTLILSFVLQVLVLLIPPIQSALDISQISLEDFERAIAIVLVAAVSLEVSKFIVSKREQQKRLGD
ncbi:cation-translocating P-type ATPase [Infirmifilum lucidum]|uniref:Cation-translocating P-type ATPase n=1 Tax=Infirmifilum lucidum TaxID=2776706 RepID=A0A7L9FHG6_9CREN|nr:cation-translocating P-type ATPase [Infirmifilum lucidum]QOJ78443.1 cation-translocating P-type ATPase [Infirmifilum lucidum]